MWEFGQLSLAVKSCASQLNNDWESDGVLWRMLWMAASLQRSTLKVSRGVNETCRLGECFMAATRSYFEITWLLLVWWGLCAAAGSPAEPPPDLRLSSPPPSWCWHCSGCSCLFLLWPAALHHCSPLDNYWRKERWNLKKHVLSYFRLLRKAELEVPPEEKKIVIRFRQTFLIKSV